jgi:glycosyltransferase involved in cell wall biosynthesis
VSRSRLPLRTFPPAHHVLLLCAHAPHKDPRISWVADHAPDGMSIHVIGVDHGRAGDATRSTGTAELVGSRELRRYSDVVPVLVALHAESPGWRTLMRIGAHEHVTDSPMLRRLVGYFLDINLSLIAEASRFDAVHAIISADLDTLPAATVLRRVFGVPLLYDAHEFWPDSNSRFEAADVEFWKGVEAELLHEVESAFIVSPQLAEFAASLYSKPFTAIPNCEPLRPMPESDPSCRPPGLAPDACVFLFQGGFAPGRGLTLLLDAWPRTDSRAVLVLRGPDPGPDVPIKDYIARSGRSSRRIFLAPPVSEERLVAAARAADVGLMPYEPSSINNRYSCPNKLSQYMAAGLPVLHNRLDYVRDVVAAAGCGREADFANTADLVNAVNELCADATLRQELGAAARRYHEERFHWQAVSAGLYRDLARLVASRAASQCHLYPRAVFPSIGLARRLGLYSITGAEAAWSRLPQPVRRALQPFARGVRRLLDPRS